MNYDVLATNQFEKKVKKLSKKHKSLKDDLLPIIDLLSEDPHFGIPLGKNCYKIRVAISSKKRGKSAGGRMITHVLVVKKTIFLLDIYDKSDQTTITEKELQYYIDLLAD